MASGNAIRGTRIGSGPARFIERGEPAPRQFISYWCANDHETRPSFAMDVQPPETWDCTRCGLPSGPDREAPPDKPHAKPFKTHIAYVMERRSEADGAALLEEALANLRRRRGE
ncbi:RNA polymerase-binding protein RbpA [Phytomonospora sp. NPDC050363]|uniref:RNA polymerase-binding protein RbpA n=1 Tax=Phytomonospora sp. NPDC050363 TaxID=3155642 RepID=UPI0034108528